MTMGGGVAGYTVGLADMGEHLIAGVKSPITPTFTQ